MWKYVKMFRLNRIPSGIWPMLTNSRLLQIGMQPTVAILFSQCTSKGNHTKDSWYQCNHQWLLWRFGLRYVVFVVQLNREKQYPKVDISAVPTSKKWDCCSYESFFKKKQYPWCWYQHGSLQQNSNGFAPIFRPWGWATCQGPSVFHVSFQSRLVAFPSTGLGKWSVASTGVYGLFSGSQL